jgi:hypothetical protein
MRRGEEKREVDARFAIFFDWREILNCTQRFRAGLTSAYGVDEGLLLARSDFDTN